MVCRVLGSSCLTFLLFSDSHVISSFGFDYLQRLISWCGPQRSQAFGGWDGPRWSWQEFNGRVQGQGTDADGCIEDNERVISLVLSCIHLYVQDDLDSSRSGPTTILRAQPRRTKKKYKKEEKNYHPNASTSNSHIVVVPPPAHRATSLRTSSLNPAGPQTTTRTRRHAPAASRSRMSPTDMRSPT
jgi:hypothetical protein